MSDYVLSNPTFSDPSQPQLQAQVILASRCTDLDVPPIITLRGRYPRVIHPEVLTHRKFGRNARSSRAVPVKKMIQEIQNTPFIPWHWGKNQKGMQARTECNEPVLVNWDDEIGHVEYKSRKDAWLEARNHAVRIADGFNQAGYHKQIVNRLLEPFMWIDVLITATSWDNFFWLRDQADAEPHLQNWAQLAHQAIQEAQVEALEPEQWHLPYITQRDRQHAYELLEDKEKRIVDLLLCKISAARCARISYKPFDSDQPDLIKDLALFEKLVGSDRLHASPCEHQAMVDPRPTLIQINQPQMGNLDPGWIQFRKLLRGEEGPK